MDFPQNYLIGGIFSRTARLGKGNFPSYNVCVCVVCRVFVFLTRRQSTNTNGDNKKIKTQRKLKRKVGHSIKFLTLDEIFRVHETFITYILTLPNRSNSPRNVRCGLMLNVLLSPNIV